MPELIEFSDDDRAVVKAAARFIEAYEPESGQAAYLRGRLDGLAGRVPHEPEDETDA